jgi:sugar phosphate isomerase/epimerase
MKKIDTRGSMDRRGFLTRIGAAGLSSLPLGALACGKKGEPAGAKALDKELKDGEGPKVGLCTIAFQERPLLEVLDLAASVGCDGVEPWGKPDHLPLTSTDDFVREVKARLDSLKIEACSYGSYLRLGDGQDPAEKDRDMDRVIQITRLLGANIARIWAGKADSELLTGEDWTLMVNDGKRFCSKAEAAGVLLALEMHGKSVTNQSSAMVDLIRRVGSPALKANYQILNKSEDPYERARVAAAYVVMVHAQNVKAGDEQPLISEGEVDFNNIYHILKQSGFAGYFEMEFVKGKTYEEKVESLKKDCAYLKTIRA